MNKLNKVGMELLQFKTELLKDYPQLVKNSLILALDNLVTAGVVDYNTSCVVKNKEQDLEFLTEYLHQKRNYIKTEMEIFKELEALRVELDSRLRDEQIFDKVITASDPNKEVLRISQKYCLDENYVMNYFEIEEVDVLRLMKRKGFVETFAVLRLTKIFKNFMKKLKEQDSENVSLTENFVSSEDSIDENIFDFSYDTGLVYFDEEKNGYSIDFYIEISVAVAENEEKLQEAVKETKYIIEQLEKYYGERNLY